MELKDLRKLRDRRNLPRRLIKLRHHLRHNSLLDINVLYADRQMCQILHLHSDTAQSVMVIMNTAMSIYLHISTFSKEVNDGREEIIYNMEVDVFDEIC